MRFHIRPLYGCWLIAIPFATAAILAAQTCQAQRAPFGFFALQGVDKSNVRDSSLRDRDTSGLSIRFSWSSIDKGSNFQWSWLDAQVKRCRAAGKPYMLRMMTGEHSPSWIPGEWHQGAPIPWNIEAKRALRQAIAALGNRYGSDPVLVGVHLSSTANHSSSEMHLAPGLERASGYTDAKVIDAWEDAIDSYASAFSNCAVILNATLEPNHRGAITYPVIDYCHRRLGLRATFQHNSLKASTPIDARHHELILDIGRAGWRIGFQMACSTGDRDRFGGTLNEAIAKSPGASYFEIYQDDIDQL